MYQLYSDIIRKINGYLIVISQFKDDIADVNISNEIIEQFGKRYCRIYIEINLKEHSDFDKEIELEDALGKHIGNFPPRYFSFHLGSGGWSEKEGTDGYNREEEIHYNYIWHLLAMRLEREKIKVSVAPFITDKQISYEREQLYKKHNEEREQLREAVKSVIPKEGQLIALKNWGNLRLAIATKVILPNKKVSFSMNLIEVLKDLSKGKKEINYINQTDIYAVIEPEKLPIRITKNELIEKLEKNEDFEGLLWRRPQELWN